MNDKNYDKSLAKAAMSPIFHWAVAIVFVAVGIYLLWSWKNNQGETKDLIWGIFLIAASVLAIYESTVDKSHRYKTSLLRNKRKKSKTNKNLPNYNYPTTPADVKKLINSGTVRSIYGTDIPILLMVSFFFISAILFGIYLWKVEEEVIQQFTKVSIGFIIIITGWAIFGYFRVARIHKIGSIENMILEDIARDIAGNDLEVLKPNSFIIELKSTKYTMSIYKPRIVLINYGNELYASAWSKQPTWLSEYNNFFTGESEINRVRTVLLRLKHSSKKQSN